MSHPIDYDTMVKILRAEGLTVKLVSGSRGRCRCHSGPHVNHGPYARGWGSVNGNVQHITAGNLGGRSVEKYIRDIINGDPNIPSKAQFVTDPDGIVWINSVGRCNHAGKVGSHVRDHLIAANFSTSDNYDSRWRGSAVDGNSWTYGNECIAAHDMNGKQYESSVRLWAAICRHLSWTGQETVGHGEISGQRTSDDPHLNMGQFRRDVMARVKHGTTTTAPPAPTDPLEEIMSWYKSKEEFEAAMAYALWSFKNAELETADAYQILRDVRDTVAPDKAPTTEPDAGGEPGKA